MGAGAVTGVASAQAQPIDIGGLTLGVQVPSPTDAVPAALVGLRVSERHVLRQPSGAPAVTLVEYVAPGVRDGSGVILMLNAEDRLIAIQRSEPLQVTSDTLATEVMTEATTKYGPATLSQTDENRSLYALYRNPSGDRFPADVAGRARADACAAATTTLLRAIANALGIEPTMPRVELPPDCGIMLTVQIVQPPPGASRRVGRMLQNGFDLDAFRQAMTPAEPRPRL